MHEDRELNRFLDGYQVANADEELLNRIVAKVSPSNVVEFKSPAHRYSWQKAAAYAAVAIIGFAYGNSTIDEEGGYADQPQVNLDKEIFGVNTFNEVIL